MSVITKRISTDGRIASLAIAGINLDAISNQLPEGAYTTFRTYQRTHAILLDDHFRRLTETAHLAGMNLSVDALTIRQVLREVLFQSPHGESRVRITVDLSKSIGDVYICVEELHVPPVQAYRTGVNTLLREMHRNNPKAKLSGFIPMAEQVRQHIQEPVNEVLMFENGTILEGLTSNFFGYMDGAFWTANEGVLSGITRKIVLENCANLGWAVRMEGVLVSKIDRLEEAFITSASRAVLPVVNIDGTIIGNGVPGPRTLQLLDAYQNTILSRAEEI